MSKEQWLCRRRGSERSHSVIKVRRGSSEEIPFIQGKEQRLQFAAGAAVKRYHTPKGPFLNHISYIGRQILYHRDNWEAPMYGVNGHKSFPGGSNGKEFACNAGDLDSIPGSGISPGEGNGKPFQYSYPENSKNRGAWRATVHEVTKE
ncbi:hypothetical protein MG293_001574 [Ovis ammon polii]|uniref:Uncharacterized protein n=1 Tax=Ovis ammon polii TaxID=230172 RepID=A0AAD4URI2_OVIAM|nr:hypothetical protein MG293_001574 [Ovis ammon polii]